MTVVPCDPEIARTVLLVGMFTQASEGSNEYSRSIPEEGTKVIATIQSDALHLAIQPAISMMSHHSYKRLVASVYFEIAAKYAEKVDGTVIQQSNIGACIANGVSQKVLARYPHMPLSLEMVCIGFQQVLMGEHIHDEEANDG